MSAKFDVQIYSLKPKAIWNAFATDNFAFWMSCAYLFFEYVRPQAIWSVFEIYPYWARTFIILAFLGWTLDQKRQFIWTRITTMVFTLLVLIILSSLSAYWPAISWSHFMDYFNWVVVFFVLTQTVTTRKRLLILLLVFLLASFKLSLYGARRWATLGFTYADWGVAGPRGFFNNPGELAIQMLMFAPIAVFFLMGIRKSLKHWQTGLLFLMPVTAALTVLATNTRGGQVALAAQLTALLLMTKHRVKALVVIGVVLAVGFSFLPEEQKTRFSSAGQDATSVQRILYWQNGWQMIKDHPFLGVGYFNFAQYYNVKHAEDLVRGVGKPAELPHNIFIQVGTDTGFTGLLLFIAILSTAFVSMHRLRKEAEAANDPFMANISKGMNLSLVGFVIAGQFVTVAYYPFLWIHLVFVTALMTVWRNERYLSTVEEPQAWRSRPGYARQNV